MQGTKNFLASMKRHGVRRVVAVSTASARDSNPSAYEEIVATADVVRASDRDWTIVRVPFLRNGPRTGHMSIGYLGHGIVGTFLSRANLADFLLRQIEDETYVREAPAISDG